MSRNNSSRVFFELFILLAILALAAYLRGTNLEQNPGWYTDEATHLNIAANLQQGNWQYLAVDDSILIFGRLPLFEMLLAGVGQFVGLNMLTLRGLVVGLELLAMLFLYLLLRIHQPRDPFLPLLAVFMLAIYPQAVLYHRFGFSYHLLTPLLILIAIGLTDYIRTRQRFWLLLASGCMGLALMTDIFALTVLPVVILVILRKRALDIFLAIPVILVPIALYALIMMNSAPDAFLYDIDFTRSRMGEADAITQIETLSNNYLQLLRLDLWFPAGIIGLFLLRPIRLRVVLLMLLIIPVLATGRVVALYHLSFYYMIPLLPLITTGVAALIRYGGAAIYRMQIPEPPAQIAFNPDDTQPSSQRPGMLRRISAGAVTIGLLIVLFGAPLIQGMVTMQQHLTESYGTSIDNFLLNPADVQQVADYVNSQTLTTDTVVTSAPIAWLLKANAADFQMAIAATGIETPHLPAMLPEARLAFNPRYDQAKFVIIDDLWRAWGVYHVQGLDNVVAEVQTWTQVFRAGTIIVYQNPSIGQ